MHDSEIMAAAVHAARVSPSGLQSHHQHQPVGLVPHPSLALPHPLHPLPQLGGGMDRGQFMYHLGFPEGHHHPLPPNHLRLQQPPLPSPLPYSSMAPVHLPSAGSFPHAQHPAPSILSSLHPSPPSSHHAAYGDLHDEDDFVDEDVDEDDMSDLEEEFQEELMALRNRQKHLQQHQQQQHQQNPDMTRQLLDFADMVNSDIHKFFGRKKGEEDSCDIYEDKWVATKSGRELYYADLLRMAQGDFGDSKSAKKSSAKNRGLEPLEDNVNSFTGKADASLGLGGLESLFDLMYRKNDIAVPPSSLTSSSSSPVVPHRSGNRKQKGHCDSPGGATSPDALPMSQRKFPASFWREPSPELQSGDEHGAGGSGSSGVGVIVTNSSSSGVTETTFTATTSSPSTALPPTSSILHSLANKLPDFTDLMESWHGGSLGSADLSHPQNLHQLQPHLHQQPPYQLHMLQQQQQQLHHLHQLQASAASAAASFASPLSSAEGGKRRRL